MFLGANEVSLRGEGHFFRGKSVGAKKCGKACAMKFIGDLNGFWPECAIRLGERPMNVERLVCR